MNLGEGPRVQAVAWARGAMPMEACGLLVGTCAADGARGRAVHRVTLSSNLAGHLARGRFVLDPAHWLAVEKEAASSGLQVLGVWHSHPADAASDPGAVPSVRDIEGAIPGWSYLILSVDSRGGACLRSWRAPDESAGGGMVEERLD